MSATMTQSRLSTVVIMPPDFPGLYELRKKFSSKTGMWEAQPLGQWYGVLSESGLCGCMLLCRFIGMWHVSDFCFQPTREGVKAKHLMISWLLEQKGQMLYFSISPKNRKMIALALRHGAQLGAHLNDRGIPLADVYCGVP